MGPDREEPEDTDGKQSGNEVVKRWPCPIPDCQVIVEDDDGETD